MLAALILTAATAMPVEWELRIGATSAHAQASSSGRFPTQARCEAAGKVILAMIGDEGGKSLKGMDVRAKSTCVQISRRQIWRRGLRGSIESR